MNTLLQIKCLIVLRIILLLYQFVSSTESSYKGALALVCLSVRKNLRNSRMNDVSCITGCCGSRLVIIQILKTLT